MTAEAVSFFGLSKKVVEDFLSTALIVDDNAYFSGERLISDTDVEISEPPERGSVKNETISGEQKAESRPEPEKKKVKYSSSHKLDAKAVIKSFSEKGIFCTVIKPEKPSLGEDLDVAKNLSENADIVVIDWSLHDDNGIRALKLISDIIESSTKKTPEQIRLVAVYTGDNDVSNIAEKIFEKIGIGKKEGDEDKKQDCSDLIRNKRSVKVIVLAKENTNLIDAYKDNIVPFNRLAGRLTEEFAKMTSGLLSNVALAGFAAIRKNTHKILSKFPPEMDEPYLTHRICLKNPEEAEDFAQKLVSDEIESLLFERSIGSNADAKSIDHWIERKIKDQDAFKHISEEIRDSISQKAIKGLIKELIDQYKQDNSNVEYEGIHHIIEEISRKFNSKVEAYFQKETNAQIFEKKELIEFASKGFEKSTSKKNLPKNSVHKKFTDVLTGRDTKEQLDMRFSYLATIRTAYSEKPPMLTLGTILQELCNTDELKYWLCIQPRCDSVRITGARAFPLIPLSASKQNDSSYPLCIPVNADKTEFKRYDFSLKPYDCRFIEFEVNNSKSGIVEAAGINGGCFFFTCQSKSEFLWIGDLKFEFAQQVADRFSKEISRVGTDTPEWLRRSAN